MIALIVGKIQSIVRNIIPYKIKLAEDKQARLTLSSLYPWPWVCYNYLRLCLTLPQIMACNVEL